MMFISATRHDGLCQPPSGHPCWHTIADAARAMDRSESAVRRAVRAAGVVRIAGPTVAGMVELRLEDGYSATSAGYLPFYA